MTPNIAPVGSPSWDRVIHNMAGIGQQTYADQVRHVRQLGDALSDANGVDDA
jgi:hypothetical protein